MVAVSACQRSSLGFGEDFKSLDVVIRGSPGVAVRRKVDKAKQAETILKCYAVFGFLGQ